MFDALKNLVTEYASGDAEKEDAKFYANDPSECELFCSSIAAIPHTAKFEFTMNSWSGNMQPVIRLIRQTFSMEGVYHPLAKLPRFSTDGANCLPVALADVMFSEEAGVVVMHGCTSTCFRAILKFVDPSRGLKRAPDPTEAVARRKACCMLADGNDDHVQYKVQMAGEFHVVNQLVALQQGAIAHCLLAQREKDTLTLLSSWPLGADAVGRFKQFFREERDYHVSAVTGKTPVKIQHDLTPLRVLKCFTSHAERVGTPASWNAPSAPASWSVPSSA